MADTSGILTFAGVATAIASAGLALARRHLELMDELSQTQQSIAVSLADLARSQAEEARHLEALRRRLDRIEDHLNLDRPAEETPPVSCPPLTPPISARTIACTRPA